MLNIGSIAARITLDSSGYKRGIGDAERANQSFGSSFSRFILNPVTLGVGAVAAVGGGFAVYANRVLASAEATQRLAQRTGLTTDTVQALRAQLNLAEGAGAKATEIFNAFAIRLGQAQAGAGAAAPAFKALGLDVERFTSVDEALRSVLNRFQELGPTIDRSKIAAELLGEQGGPLLVQALEGTGTIEELVARMRDFGQVIERDTIDKVASLNTTLGFAKLGFQGLLQLALSEFLAVFADESGRADEQLRVLFRGIKDEAIPAVQQLGSDIQSITGNINDMIAAIDRVVNGIQRARGVVGPGYFGAVSLARGVLDGTVENWRSGYGEGRNSLPPSEDVARDAARRNVAK